MASVWCYSHDAVSVLQDFLIRDHFFAAYLVVFAVDYQRRDLNVHYQIRASLASVHFIFSLETLPLVSEHSAYQMSVEHPKRPRV